MDNIQKYDLFEHPLEMINDHGIYCNYRKGFENIDQAFAEYINTLPDTGGTWCRNAGAYIFLKCEDFDNIYVGFCPFSNLSNDLKSIVLYYIKSFIESYKFEDSPSLKFKENQDNWWGLVDENKQEFRLEFDWSI